MNLIPRFTASIFILIFTLVSFSTQAQTNDYCNSYGRNAQYFWIDSLIFSDRSLISGQDGGYFQHQSKINLQPGENTLDLNIGYRSYNYGVYWRGWVDLNGDGAFTNDEIVFDLYGQGSHNVVFDIPPPSVADTTLRIAMKYGRAASPCEIYYYGETEDVPVSFEYEPTYSYELNLTPGLNIERSGELGENLTWVIERDGEVVLRRLAANELEYRYYANYPGSIYRVWLEQFINGAYQQVSNVVNYESGVTDRFDLYLNDDYELSRSGEIGDSVQWVIEENGTVVLQRLATNELNYTYFRNTIGNQYRVWLQQYIDGEYKVVSNPVSYEVSLPSYDISIDDEYQLSRSGNLGAPLTWVIEKDGVIVLERNAANELQYTYFSNTPGSSFKVWLKQFIDGRYEIVSNIVEYEIPNEQETPHYDLSVNENYQLQRSGEIGDPLTWVIEKDGNIVLQRNAANELQYTYFSNTPGSSFKVWLKQPINGRYEVVSDIVEYEIQDETEQTHYELTVDENYLLQRNGEIGDPLTWVIEKDGNIVLQRNAANELSYTYFNNSDESHFRVWLKQFIDGEYRVVSNIVEYGNTDVNWTISVAADYTVTRSGEIGDNLQWVIIKNGNVALQRVASNELSYRYYSNTYGSTIEVYLQAFIDGAYRQVSNSISYTVD